MDGKRLNKSLALSLILIGIFIFILAIEVKPIIVSLIGMLGGSILVAVELTFLIRELNKLK